MNLLVTYQQQQQQHCNPFSFLAEVPFGSVPVLYIDGEPLLTSGAITRYLATRYGLNGSDTAQCAYVEMYSTLLTEAYSKIPFFETDIKVKVRDAHALLIFAWSCLDKGSLFVCSTLQSPTWGQRFYSCLLQLSLSRSHQ